MLTLEELEPRHTPATLDVAGAALAFTSNPGETNSLTVAVSGGVYSFKDAGAPITLTPAAVAVGWRGSGTNTVSGPELSVDDISVYVDAGAVNVRSCRDPLDITGGTGAVTVTLNSVAPAHIGNLSTITAPVNVNAGADTTLKVSNFLAPVPSTNILIDATGIYLPGCQPVTYTGAFSTIRVWGPNGTPISQYVVSAPPTSNLLLN
jgi:hypothetical protein